MIKLRLELPQVAGGEHHVSGGQLQGRSWPGAQGGIGCRSAAATSYSFRESCATGHAWP